MTDIVNDKFEVGEKYIGQMNGALFEVTNIHRVPIRFHDVIIPGSYVRGEPLTEYVPYILTEKIEFTELKTGYKHETDLEWAKRLLLKKYG